MYASLHTLSSEDFLPLCPPMASSSPKLNTNRTKSQIPTGKQGKDKQSKPKFTRPLKVIVVIKFSEYYEQGC